MSVNAINGVDAQQQPQKHSALPSAIAGGVGLGAVGAAGGWFLGGKKPTLEELFTQRPDTFTKKEITEKDSEAAKKLEDAVTEYKEVNTKGEVKNANKAVYDSIQAQQLEKQDDLNKAITEAQTKLDQKKVKIGESDKTLADVNAKIKEAQDKLKSATTDEEKNAAKNDLKNARADRKTFLEGAMDERKALSKAKADLRKAKMDQFAERAKTEANAEYGIADKLTKAKNKLTEAKSSKLKEILDRKEIKEAFGKIEGAIKKEGKGKMAAIAGGIAAAVGLIGGYMMGGSHSDKA